MSLFIYNTLTRKKEEFKPIHPPKVGLYVCGVTVYDECHLGHARALINFDVIYRYLKFTGYDVTFVRNFTDVDDKIIARAQKEKISWEEVATKYIATFHRDTKNLGLVTPSLEPKATEHIPDMLHIIEALEKKGMAYAAGGDVFYSVRKKVDYGKLSGKKIEELEVGARVDVLEAKTDPLDFALWKGSKPGEPTWDSPWGKGRPGWHIECSAMSMKYLGETFDIHGGGRDLSFPHHENEIAQSEGATGKTFAKYWVHNGFVNINAEKMSKSLGNFLTIDSLLQKYHPEVIRLFILAAHYRSPLDYTDQNIENARQSLIRWYGTCTRVEALNPTQEHLLGDPSIVELNEKLHQFKTYFVQAMDDDFNTAKVVGALFDITRLWNKVLDENKNVPAFLVETFNEVVKQVHEVLGIFGSSPARFFEKEKTAAMQKSNLTPEAIEQKIKERKQARIDKNFALADTIRKELTEASIQIKDNPDGTTSWSIS
ncbi:MAG: cysteine--tRNA ligase [Deltaproteobacteria bacterium GWA2_45_12]|nr:MAG: cysteine--tRNA ligase [Deltaproteobacteria bacterium GWA2_45_12]